LRRSEDIDLIAETCVDATCNVIESYFWGKPLKSVFYVEDDFVAGLLKQYFNGTGNSAVFLKSDQFDTDSADLFIAQSEDPEKLSKVLENVRRQPRKIPTIVLTSHYERIAEKYKSFVHFVALRELLESNFRWHIRLARTARIVEEVKNHFEGAEAVLILLQDDPDPDAIASGLALRQVLGRNKQTAPLGSFGRVTRPENIAMVKLLEIEIEKLTRESIKTFDRIAVVDLQPPHLSSPPEEIDLVIDHHPEQFNYKSHLKDIRPSYGATSTILLEYLLCTGSSIGTRLGTALLYGIKSDTFALSREVNEWDVQAFSYLYQLANQNLMRRIERPELPPAALDALSVALKNRRVIDRVAFVNLGRVERDDLIPQMADFSLSFEGIEWAFVSGVYESNYIISVRNVGYVRSAGRVLKEAFGAIGSAGGHASMAKAIIPLGSQSIKQMDRKVQQKFLHALHSSK
jgi:nanoRNase/pAp phosphatase (c-di-AMP/oligoRNAs hydrolase)